ncbi:MAG: endonuclease MutS2, partial [Atribacterota bacterium]
MKCPSDILKTFDFDKIVLKLCSLAVCPVTRELLARLEPAPTVEEANQRLTTVQQYQEMITFDGNIDFRGLSDLRTIYQKMSIAGSLLPGEEIIRFLDFLLLCERTRQFFLEKNLKNKYSLLQDLFLEIGHFEGWIKKINSIMAPDGQILDRASEKLFTIRKRIQQIHEKIRITIDALLRNRDLSPMMQDQTFTIRRGRYVIPIKSEFRHRVEGLVVDYSSSGSSVFIEPKSLLFLNNELEVLTIQEGEEIERILRHLTASLAPSLPDFEKAFQRLITLDSLQAKARLGQLWNADIPVIGGEELLIRKGRHPLLGERAVPFNLQLTPEKKIMIISGPNAGGKTVLLKSLALIVYLAICGVPVPVDRGSRIPFYQTLYIDIGDHQDIEQNLSTFSSRLLSLQSSLVQASKESLFLIDEIGAGTDPNEGSALGIGIISYLLEHGSTGVFTTHLP